MRFINWEQLISNGNTKELQRKRKDILELLTAAIDAVNPYFVIESRFQDSGITIDSEIISLQDFNHIYVASFGKASIGMMQAILDQCSITKGIVITNDVEKTIDHPCVQTFHGGHPLPNEGSIDGTKAIEEMISLVSDSDLLIVLISGGGSALLCHPRISLEDMAHTTSLLLKSGASIQEINTIRKHLSYVKGGQLIKNVKGRIISYVISDVIDDPLGFIASGPTFGDETSFIQAQQIFHRYALWDHIPLSTQLVISKGMKGELPETPSEADIHKKKVSNIIVANNTLACETIVDAAKRMGYNPLLLSTPLQGEAKKVGNELIEILLQKHKENNVDLLIAGGETTVTVTGSGKGGRNQEMVLSSLENLQNHSLVFASCGTDGIDGASTAAGAIADPYTKSKADEKQLDITQFLKENNSNAFFDLLDDLLLTGPTGTNVMDIQILVK